MPRSTLNPIAENQYLITISTIDAYWSSCTALKETATKSNYNNGLSNRSQSLHGAREADSITLSKAFDPVADKPIIDWWKNWCSGNGDLVDVTVTPVNYCPEPEPIGSSMTYSRCRPESLEGFAADKTSQNVAMLTLILSFEDWSYE